VQRRPINEGQILASLEKRGTVLDAIEPDDLFEFDQDHYGGVAAVEALAERAGIGSESVVLDLCAGLGGPARYLAWRFGCRVAGVDITASRVASARRLTELVGLGDLVEFIEADATKLPLPSRSYTACISQEAFVHIVDKERLFAECHRVLEPGGTLAFTDWTAGERLEPSERERLRSTFAASGLSTVDGYRSALRDCGFGEVAVDDLSAQWVGVLRERLEMYRSLRDDTIARFGAAHYEAYADNYAFFVGLIEAGRLGGARLTSARLASQGRHGHHESPA
jgi:ubiquinone/menaquinone biosynthesis C-methylase UbiE